MHDVSDPGITLLASRFGGELIRPQDASFDETRRILNGMIDRRPALIAQPRSVQDIAEVVRFASSQGLPLAVRGGGHSIAGFSVIDDAVLCDCSLMNEVRVDPEARTITAGPGTRWHDVDTASSAHGLATPGGTISHTGVAGFTLGGGFGFLTKMYGVACDNLVDTEVVLATGEIVRANETENPDLFWAIRGGGGNFGVVTSFTVVAQPVAQVFFGQILFAPDETAEVLRGWAAYMACAPEELTSTAMCWPTFGEDAAPVAIMVCFAGDDDAAAGPAIDPIRKLGTVVDDQVRLMPYGEVLADVNELPPGWRPRVRNRFAPAVSGELVTTILAQQAKLANLYVEIRSIGGALNLVAEDETAFAHRDTQALIMGVLLGSPEDNEPLLPTYEEFWSALAPSMSGAYSGFLSDILPADVEAVYPPQVYRRLAAVKREYDPGNVFHLNVNVEPAAGE
jgi:FAD/FMN-containing dehydrogenase